MKTLRLLWLAVMMAFACGKDPAGVNPPPPPAPTIVSLIMADDAGFWRGQKISLTQLVRGAINSDGDTVAAPAVTWEIPVGFARQGDSLAATREARGLLQASFGSIADSVVAASMDNLAARGPWSSEHTCYNSPHGQRGVEEPPIGVDSAIIRRSNGEVTYSETEWRSVFKLTVAVDERVIVFWKDGVVDTTFNRTAIIAMQDTLAVALGSNIGSAAPWMKRTSEGPIVYRLDAPGICHSFEGGTAYELRATS